MRSRAPALTSSFWAVIISGDILRRGGGGSPIGDARALLCAEVGSSTRHDLRKGTTHALQPEGRHQRRSRRRRGPRGGGGGGGPMRIPMPGGTRAGGGIGGLIIIILFVVLTQCMGGGGLPGRGGGTSTQGQAQGEPEGIDTGDERYANCKTGADANDDVDCARKAVALSLEQYWAKTLPEQAGTEFTPAQIITFAGGVATGCGQATSQVGPLLLPARPADLPRHDLLRRRPRGTARRPGRRLRRALRPRPRVRPPHPEPARHHGPGPHPEGPRLRRRTPRAAGRLLRRHVDPRRQRRRRHPDRPRPGRHRRGARLRQDRRRRPDPAEVRPGRRPRGLDPRLVGAADGAGSPVGYQEGTLQACDTFSACRSDPAGQRSRAAPRSDRPGAASSGCTAPRWGGGTCRPARPRRPRPGRSAQSSRVRAV